MAESQEVKICVNEHGVLVAVLPDGHKKDIVVDVFDLAHYGILRLQ